MHIILFVEELRGKCYYIRKDKKNVELHKMDSAKFHAFYTLEYTNYPLAGFATRTMGLRDLGVVITPSANAHLRAIISQEPSMAKPTAPVSTKTTALPEPKAKVATAKAAEPKAVKVSEPKAPKEPKAEGEGRTRRDKFDSSAKIKAIGKNTARVGSVRHSIVETILMAKTVAEALDSTVQRKDGTDYKIGTPDIYFALETGLIELV